MTTAPTDGRPRPAPAPRPQPPTRHRRGAGPTEHPRRQPSALRIFLGLHVAALAVAAMVAVVPGAATETRHALTLNLHPPAGSIDDVVSIFAHNLVVLVPLLAGPMLAGRAVACALRVYGVWLLASSALMVGAALGGYGRALLPHLPHVPFEWLALASAAVDSDPRVDIARIATAFGALSIAALLETLV